MTKLTEWLSGLVVFFGVYWILVTRKVSNQFTEDFFFHIQISPIVIVLLLGVYAVTTVLYRTLTFNECKEAAAELMEEIKDAKKDLKSKGFNFAE